MKTHWKPTEKQTEALRRLEFEILFGGSRGGGKTDTGMVWLLYDKDHPKYRALVIRKNADDLKDWIDRAGRMFRPTGAVIVGNPPEVRFPSGAIIRTGHLKDDSAYMKYQGHEYHKMVMEELTQIPSEKLYLQLIASCRSTVSEIKPQVFATTNPDGPGHKWVKARFVTVTKPGVPYLDPVTGSGRIFIPAKIEDNPHLMEKDPRYVRMLDGLPDGLKQAWRDGSWDELYVEGAYYKDEIVKARKEGRIKLVPHDPALLVHTVWDLGISDSMTIGFWQRISNEMRLVDYYEQTDVGFPHYIAMLKNKGYVYGKHFAPHDIEVRELSSGKSRKQIAKALGIEFTVIPNLPISDGINAFRMLWPRLWVNEPACQGFLDAVAQYRREWSDKEGQFKDTPLHDWTSHAADMGRYAALVENQMTNEQDRIDWRPPAAQTLSDYEG